MKTVVCRIDLALNNVNEVISREKANNFKIIDDNVNVPKADENKNISKQKNNDKQ